MTTRVQTNRLVTAGTRPATGARLPGEFYSNLPDFQFGVINPLKAPIDLLPVRFFSASASYSIGQFVWNGGQLYRAIQSVAPGSFLASQWKQVLTLTDVVGVYMPIAGGTFTGPIVAPIGSTIAGYMPTSGGAFTGPITAPTGSIIAGYMPLTGGVFSGPIIAPAGSVIVGYMSASDIANYLALAGGTMTGPLLLSEYPIDPMEAVTKLYVDEAIAGIGSGGGGPGAFVPLAGGTMVGPLVMNETGIGLFAASGSTHRVISGFTGDPSVPANRRWDLVMGTNLAESLGTNAGSNFGVIAYDDNGVQLSSWNTNRASGRLTFNGVGAAPHTVTNYPPDVGSATIVLNRLGSGHNCGIVASSGGLNRWGLNLSDATPESTGNQGSNFSLTGIADDGHAPLGEIDFNRMSMRMSLNGVGATPHSVATYPPDVGSATIVLNRSGSGHNCGIVASSAGLNRWALNLSDTNAEGVGDSGSDLDITGFKQDGKTVTGALNFMRANGRLSLNGVGATPRSLTQYPALVGNANFVLNAAPNFEMSVTASNHGLNRWQLVLGDGTPESGAQAGSGMALNYFTDAGNFSGSSMTISRQNGRVNFPQGLVNGSDITTKTDIEPVKDALSIIEKLEGVFYKRKGSFKREVGLIAQQVAPALPEVVFETGQPRDAEGKEIASVDPLLGISYGNVVAVLINAVKELSAKIKVLEGKPA